MLKHYLILIALVIPLTAAAQWPGQERLSTWEVPSLDEVELPSDLIDFKAFYNQNRYSNHDECLSHLLDSIGEEVTIFFDSGTYSFQKSIILGSHQVLLGAGSQLTHFIFDLGGVNQHAIHLKGSINPTQTPIDEDLKLGEKSIKTSPNNFTKGDLIKIGYDDAQDVHNSWANGSIAQLVTVTDLDLNGITINEKSRLNLSENQSPRIIKINPVRQSGVANLSIERQDATKGQTSNIRCDYTQDCFFIGLESNLCNFAHIDIRNSHRTIVSGCYFHHGHDYGSGGKTYGVVLEFSSSSCLVSSNIFTNLRHSILFQAGSNGNVIYGNYSREAYWTDVMSPNSFGGDIVFHGNGPFRNLVELNVCQNLVIDNSHGTNGKNNVFYRNRAEHAGIFMNCSPASDGQIFLSNEVTGSGFEFHNGIPFPKGLYVLCGEEHIELNNVVQGQLRSPKDSTKDTMSFFLKNTKEDARIGYPKANSISLDAELRFSSEWRTLPLNTNYAFDFQFTSARAVRNKIDKQRVTLDWETTSLFKSAQFTVVRMGRTIDTLGTVNALDSETRYTFVDSSADPNEDYTYQIWYHNRMGFRRFSSVSVSAWANTKLLKNTKLQYPYQLHIWTFDGKQIHQTSVHSETELKKLYEDLCGPYLFHFQKGDEAFFRKIWINP
jgi:hypothetical protein